MNDPPPSSQSFEVNLTGDVSGQVAIGTNITQHSTEAAAGYIHASQPILESIVTLLDSVRTKLPESDRHSLDTALADFRRQTDDHTCPDPGQLVQKLAEEPRITYALARSNVDLSKLFDVFISHASADKESFARPLADALVEKGMRVWYDEFSLKAGDNLRSAIDRALTDVPCAIIVLSPHYIRGDWTRYEFDGLVISELESGKTIIPIWLNVSKEDVIHFSAPIANKLALDSSVMSIEVMASTIATRLAEERERP
jgi:hypothetical protein